MQYSISPVYGYFNTDIDNYFDVLTADSYVPKLTASDVTYSL
jgi:hypothetical protein